MKKPIALTVSALLAGTCLAGGALAQSGQTGTAGQTPPATGSTGAPTKAERSADAKSASQLASADVRFLKQAAQNGLAEIEAAKLAQSKATNSELKSFAQHLIDDHTKAHDELKQLAQSKGVELPNEPSVAQRAKLKMLAGAEGDRFDRRFSDQFGVKAHEETIRMFRNAAGKAQDADVKSFAQTTLTGLEKHLSMAQNIHSSIAPGRRMGSGTEAGSGTTSSDTRSTDQAGKADKPEKK